MDHMVPKILLSILLTKFYSQFLKQLLVATFNSSPYQDPRIKASVFTHFWYYLSYRKNVLLLRCNY